MKLVPSVSMTEPIERWLGKATTIFRLAIVLTLAIISPVDAQDLLWAKRAGGTALDLGQAIAVDALGNSYVTGRFGLSATFGPGETNQTTLATTGQDVFVAKYHLGGFLQWANRIAGTAAFGNGIAVDGVGNVYVTGSFANSVTFAPGTGNETILTSAGGDDFFVAKYNPSGVFLWAKKAGGLLSVDVSHGIAVDSGGSSYVTGSFSGEATFGLGEANQTTLTAPGSADVFVAKYNSNGLFQWVRRGGGANSDQGWAIAADSLGNSYVTGSFNGPATFSPGAGQIILTTAVGSVDVFVAKYDANGTLLWAKSAAGTTGGTTIDSGYGIAADIAGNSYVTGSFQQSVTFGSGEASQTALTADGDSDIFIAKYNSNGALLWAKRAGGAGIDFGQAIAADAFGNSYVTGYFRDAQATFGLGETKQAVLTSDGNEDVFVAKYSSIGLLQWARRAGGTSDDRGLGIGVDGVGNSHVTGRFASTATFGPGEANQTMLLSANNADIFVAKFAAGVIEVNCPTDSLQIAVNLAAPGATILVTGTCSENILIRNEKQRITIDGGGTAVISAPSSASPAVNIRGKGILLQNFTVTGGSQGVWVNRGSNAVLNTNVIQNSGGSGVLVDELAFAVLINNTVRNNPGAGIVVQDNSTARIGFNADSETVASANFIYENGVGIVVSNGSSARIVGNTIDSNTGDAIQVLRDSHGEIASNQIFTNGGDGIEVAENSTVQLGEDGGTNIFESPNESSNANLGFGIRCSNGGVADGRLGTLNGILAAKEIISPTCIDSLN